MANGCQCPKVPELKIPCKDEDDECDWDIMCAELNNGQKIAIKYRRSCYEFKTTAYDQPCKEPPAKTTKSEERLNVYMIGLMEQMHKIMAAQENKNQ